GFSCCPARSHVLQRQEFSRALSRRRLHRHAWFLEPLELGWLQSRLRALRERQAQWLDRRLSYWLYRQPERPRGLRATGGSGGMDGRLAAGGRRRGRKDLAGQRATKRLRAVRVLIMRAESPSSFQKSRRRRHH